MISGPVFASAGTDTARSMLLPAQVTVGPCSSPQARVTPSVPELKVTGPVSMTPAAGVTVIGSVLMALAGSGSARSVRSDAIPVRTVTVIGTLGAAGSVPMETLPVPPAASGVADTEMVTVTLECPFSTGRGAAQLSAPVGAQLIDSARNADDRRAAAGRPTSTPVTSTPAGMTMVNGWAVELSSPELVMVKESVPVPPAVTVPDAMSATVRSAGVGTGGSVD
jgi:hypothetical protein